VSHRIIVSDCIAAMRAMPDASVDSVVTDPPYELGFMGKSWDASGIAYSVEMWREVLRVLKPGGHLLAFGGPRTYHRMACAIEDAGFEIRDSIDWVFGSGFPKSLNVSKAIDDALGAERQVIGPQRGGTCPGGSACTHGGNSILGATVHAPATAPATAYDGWGTALKPAREPIVLARRPLIGTVAANVLAYGTGGLNIEACRVGTAPGEDLAALARRSGGERGFSKDAYVGGSVGGGLPPGWDPSAGRWPPNLIFTHDPECGRECMRGCPVRELNEQSGELTSGIPSANAPSDTTAGIYGKYGTRSGVGGGDSGGASRFFPVFRYVAKPSRGERDAGLWDVEPGVINTDTPPGTLGSNSPRAGAGRNGGARNVHPTVKPIALMEWLCKLVTPSGGTVLDPFLGSGTTGCAAVRCGFNFIGIDRDAGYAAIAERRIDLALNAPRSRDIGSLEQPERDVNQLALF